MFEFLFSKPAVGKTAPTIWVSVKRSKSEGVVMTKHERILAVLENNGPSNRGYTAGQLAGLVSTTVASVRARISELRRSGYAVYANTRAKDNKTFYRLGKPSREMVAQAYATSGSAAFNK
jgi:predicted ArsR family transcriptional regulator